jgi:hypothetical protein
MSPFRAAKWRQYARAYLCDVLDPMCWMVAASKLRNNDDSEKIIIDFSKD